MIFIYKSPDDETMIGLTAPILDQHGRALVPPTIVPHDHPEAARKIVHNKSFEVDEHKESALCQWLRIDKRFQRLGR